MRISTHTPLARRDLFSSHYPLSSLKFLLTRLLRGVTNLFVAFHDEFVISTHTPLARRDSDLTRRISGESISTHTPLARRDKDAGFSCETFVISTHTPLARRDCPDSAANVHPYLFLLTRLLRGVTAAVFLLLCFRKFLLTRLLRGVTRRLSPCFHPLSFLLTRLLRGVTCWLLRCGRIQIISTHTPLARRDRPHIILKFLRKNFYSHASCEA